MEIEISVINTKTVTNKTEIKDFVFSDAEWDINGIEISNVKGKEEQAKNEPYNAISFLLDGFGAVLSFSENLDEDDIENIYPIYKATDQRKRKRGYIYDFKENEGIKTRIILIAPKNYLPSLL
jgi:hypothetical protein